MWPLANSIPNHTLPSIHNNESDLHLIDVCVCKSRFSGFQLFTKPTNTPTQSPHVRKWDIKYRDRPLASPHRCLALGRGAGETFTIITSSPSESSSVITRKQVAAGEFLTAADSAHNMLYSPPNSKSNRPLMRWGFLLTVFIGAVSFPDCNPNNLLGTRLFGRGWRCGARVCKYGLLDWHRVPDAAGEERKSLLQTLLCLNCHHVSAVFSSRCRSRGNGTRGQYWGKVHACVSDSFKWIMSSLPSARRYCREC